MRKGTFSQQKAKPNSSAHNSRSNPPKYLIGLEPGTENYYELIQSDEDFIAAAKSKYKEKIKQTMQKKQVENLIQETVLTLKPEQDENDVKKLFKKLNKKYGGHELLEVSVHRDEGHFEKDGIAYYPTKDILQIDGDWYICSDPNIAEPKKDQFDTKVDINDFKKVYNYHAHAKFSMFDRTLGKSARMQKKDMSERLKFVSNELGLKYDPSTKIAGRKSVNQIKDEHHARANTQRQALAKVKDLKAEVKKLKTKLTLTQEDHKNLRAFEKELHSKIKAKDLTIEDMQLELDTLTVELANSTLENQRGYEVYQEVQFQQIAFEEENIKLRNANKALEEQKKVLEVKVVDLEEKSVSRPNMSDYEAILEKNKKLISKNKRLEEYKTNYRKNINIIIQLKKDLEMPKEAGFRGWIKEKFNQFKEEILGLKADKTLLTKQINSLQLENDRLVEEMENLKNDVKVTDQLREDLEAELEKLTNQNEKTVDNSYEVGM